jgi:hypothetical protein
VEWRDPTTKKRLGALDLAAVVAVLPRKGKGHKPGLLSRAVASEDSCIVMECADEKRCVVSTFKLLVVFGL